MSKRQLYWTWALLLALLGLAACSGPAATEPPAEPTAANELPPTLEPSTEEPEAESGGEDTTPADPAAPEAAAIYSAVVRQLYTQDHTFNEPPNWPRIYILTSTDDSVGGTGEPPNAAPIEPAVQEAITAGLGDLPAEILWVPDWDAVPINPDNGAVDEGDGVIITLGNVYEQDDGSVHVAASLHCGGLCATGMTYILENTGAGWEITGTTGPAWMS